MCTCTCTQKTCALYCHTLHFLTVTDAIMANFMGCVCRGFVCRVSEGRSPGRNVGCGNAHHMWPVTVTDALAATCVGCVCRGCVYKWSVCM